VLASAHLFAVWHASPLEIGRHAIVPAVTIHASLLVLIAVTVDRALARRPTTGS
jgi:hypothetical protein